MVLTVKVSQPGELVAVMPHLLGFAPADSVVCLPMGGGAPATRVDHPHQDEDFALVVDSLSPVYKRHPAPVVMVAVTQDRVAAAKMFRLMSEELGEQLKGGIRAHGNEWMDLATGVTGTVDPSSRERLAAEMALGGVRQPAASREAMAAQVQPDPVAVAAVREHLADLIDSRADDFLATDLVAETTWLTTQIAAFVDTQIPVDNQTAGRILLDMHVPALRDSAVLVMTADAAAEHTALWSDLTRRSPEEVRSPAAALLAFASFQQGDGARSWAALDLIPEQQRTDVALATITAQLLQVAAHPKDWRPAEFAASASSGAQTLRTSGARAGLRPPPATGAHRHRSEPDPGGPTAPSAAPGR